MIAARLHIVGEPLRIDHVADPQPSPGEVLVKVCAAGICGSDLHLLSGETQLPRLPCILGHEISGVVVSGCDDELSPGTRVCVHYLIACGRCRYCRLGRETLCQHRELLGVHRDGGFAEFVVAPRDNVLPLPPTVSFPEAAILVDALATPFHAITKRMHLLPGDSVAVFGIGGLGLHAVQLLHIVGAERIIAVDIDRVALDRACSVGATDTVDASRQDPVQVVRILTKGGADFALEFVGREETRSAAILSLRPGGRAVLVGHGGVSVTTPSAGDFVRGEVEVVGAYGAARSEVAMLLELLAANRISLEKSITHQLPLERINDAFALLRSRAGSPARVVIYPGS